MANGTLAAEGATPVAKAPVAKAASQGTPPAATLGASPAPSTAAKLDTTLAPSPAASSAANPRTALWQSLVAATLGPSTKAKPALAQVESTAVAPAPLPAPLVESPEMPLEAPRPEKPPPAAAIHAEPPPIKTLPAEGEAKPGESKAVPPTALAPGFRFHPTDEELVSYYLKRKVMNKPARYNAIAETDIYRYDPWDLEEFSRLKTRDQEWFFFSVLDRKYGSGARLNRTTKTGYWKATGKDREISRDSNLLGSKKTLVFHTGRSPEGTRTNWVMHEYRLSDSVFVKNNNQTQYYVLCRVFHKSNLGQPNANRYAPFMEEEWDDPAGGLIPADDLRDNSTKDAEQENQPVTRELIDINELPEEDQPGDNLHGENENVSRGRKRDRDEDEYVPVYVQNQAVSLPPFIKKMRHDDSGNSIGDQNYSSPPSTNGSSEGVIAVPHDCVELFYHMQRQIHEMSCEIKTLKFDKIASESLITILQTRLDNAYKENEELKNRIKSAVNNE